MARRSRQGDVAATVQDMRRGLAEWWDAVRTLGANPVLAVLRRRETGRRTPPGAALFGQAHSAMALLFAGYVLLDQLNRWHTLDQPSPALVQLLLVAFGVYVLLLGNGLYRVAVDALALISRAESGRLVRVQLDDTMLAARLSDRELTVALVASLLPRLWLSWFTAPLMAPLAFTLFALWTQPQEGQQSILPSFIYYGTGLKHLLSRVPESAAVLLVLGLLSSVLLLLWLIAVGRSLRHPWQIEITALTVTVSQLAWVPAAYFICFQWVKFGGEPLERVLIPVPFAVLLALALVVATLHFTRRRPMVRTLIAAAGPLLAASALILTSIYDVLLVKQVRFPPALHFLNNAVWSLGPFALINPLGLPSPTYIGMTAWARENFCVFQLFRLPLLIALLVAYIAVCTHAARLAVFDWRYSED